MIKQRRDKRGRVLRTGEGQRKDGRYSYQWFDVRGERRTVYSWRLNPSDKTPRGKHSEKSLRELEAEIEKDMSKGIVSNSTITINELIKDFMLISKSTVKRSTYVITYEIDAKRIDKLGWGKLKVKSVTTNAAKKMIQQLCDNGASNITAYRVKKFLKQVFDIAVEDDLIVKNPFAFKMRVPITLNEREALTPEEQKRFLDFLKSDPELYEKHYDQVVFLMNTGLRASEFCGLTISDVDFENRVIRVNKQLFNEGKNVYRIDTPKSKAGIRIVPLNDSAFEAVSSLIRNRETRGKDFTVDGYKDFILLNRNGVGMHVTILGKHFRILTAQYNDTHKHPIKVTPHVLRHTFCSNCVRSGLNPKVIQRIMGHSSMAMTMGVYTHITNQEIVDSFLSSNVDVQ